MINSNNESVKLATLIRVNALKMVHRSKASHIGTGLSMADILAVLYNNILKHNPQNPYWNERDRFILSKGHGAAALYALLAEQGYFPKAWLDTYCQNDGKLPGHTTTHGIPGIEISAGSLGHGLPVACGMALAAKTDGDTFKVFVLLGDGECDEGSIWEAALFAGHHKLDNLIAIIDHNKIQALGNTNEVLDISPLAGKWEDFNWRVREIDGHDHGQIENALNNLPVEKNKPTCIIAHTVKGKGISFMENKLEWHYKSPDSEQLSEALHELGVIE
ncbi:MAG: transketolase [Dehalococcoidales bacterium]|nr:transketolase [Dehalococcoidales bacterium]